MVKISKQSRRGSPRLLVLARGMIVASADYALGATVREAFATGGSLEFEGRRWRVAAYTVDNKIGGGIECWRATLEEVQP